MILKVLLSTVTTLALLELRLTYLNPLFWQNLNWVQR